MSCNYTGPGHCECGQSGQANRDRTAYGQAVLRGRARWGSEYVEPATNADQREHFNGARVEVTTTYPSGDKFVRRGRIGITTGWEPSLMLLHRRNSSGSWDLLDADDQITAVVSA